MKITDVRVEHYRWPKTKPIANGKHTYTHNDLNLLVIDTDEGITGYGCSWAIEFAESMGKAIIGMDPLCNEQIFAKTYVPKFIGRRGTSAKTVSAIDMAVWDIKAKAANLPLYNFLEVPETGWTAMWQAVIMHQEKVLKNSSRKWMNI